MSGDPRFETDLEFDDDVRPSDVELEPPDPPLGEEVELEPPDPPLGEEVALAPDSLEPDRTLVTDPEAESMPELAPPVAPLTVSVRLPVASSTVPVTPLAASSRVPVTSVTSRLCDVVDERSEVTVGTGSRIPAAAGLVNAPPRAIATKRKMRIAADAILKGCTRLLPDETDDFGPERLDSYEMADSPSSDLTSAKKSGSGRTL